MFTKQEAADIVKRIVKGEDRVKEHYAADHAYMLVDEPDCSLTGFTIGTSSNSWVQVRKGLDGIIEYMTVCTGGVGDPNYLLPNGEVIMNGDEGWHELLTRHEEDDDSSYMT